MFLARGIYELMLTSTKKGKSVGGTTQRDLPDLKDSKAKRCVAGERIGAALAEI